MLKKAVFALALLIVVVAFGLVAGLVAYHFAPNLGRLGYNSPVLLDRVQQMHDLVTVKYVLEKVVVFDDPKWYGDNRVLLVAHGTVKAGIDLSALKPGDIEYSDRDKKITLTLPPAQVMDVYLDDQRTQIVERSTGLMRSFDKDLEQNARIVAVNDLRRAAEQGGILNDATERAKVELTSLLKQLGFTQVSFRQK